MNSLLSILDIPASDKHHAIAQECEVWDRMEDASSIDYLTRLSATVSKTYHFMVLLTKPSTDEERTVDLVTDSDRFVDILRIIKSKYPGWHLVETWEPSDEF